MGNSCVSKKQKVFNPEEQVQKQVQEQVQKQVQEQEPKSLFSSLSRQQVMDLLWKEYLDRPLGHTCMICNTCGVDQFGCTCHLTYFLSKLTDVDILECKNRETNWKYVRKNDIEKMWESKLIHLVQYSGPSFMCEKCKTATFLVCSCAKSNFVESLTHFELMRFLRKCQDI